MEEPRMDVQKAVRTRRSIRKYQPFEIPEEKLKRVLEAGRLSPSAANQQPWHFIIITKPENREKLRAAYAADWFIQAPAILVVCADPFQAWTRRDGEEYWKVDAAIAMQSMALAATEEGLGTCWIGAFDEREAKKALGIPEKIRVVAMTPLGYPAETKGEVRDRKPLEKILHREGW
jgi:nitroreductase